MLPKPFRLLSFFRLCPLYLPGRMHLLIKDTPVPVAGAAKLQRPPEFAGEAKWEFTRV
jgi:hypothetical protein